MHIGSLLYPQIKLADPSKDCSHGLKRFIWRLSIQVLTGSSLTLQQQRCIIQLFVNIIPLSLQVLKLIIKKIAPPSKVVLNKDNMLLSLHCLKLLSAIFIKFFHQMIVLQKLWKMLFISSKKLFSFSRYSNFCISVLFFFSTCQPLL